MIDYDVTINGISVAASYSEQAAGGIFLPLLRKLTEIQRKKGQRSFIRDELPGYLNVFAFAMNPPHNKLEKMEVLLHLAFQNRQIIRYRDFYQAKSKVVDDF